jgi:hypothetical protein
MTDRILDIRFEGRLIHMDMPELVNGREVRIYGQQEVVKDLNCGKARGRRRAVV